jgi:hypothetical protein
MRLDTKTYWLTDRQSQCNFDFDYERDLLRQCGLRWPPASELFVRQSPVIKDVNTEDEEATAL